MKTKKELAIEIAAWAIVCVTFYAIWLVWKS